MILYESVSEQLICGCGGTGRRAGLRNQCQRRGGSSPFIRTKRIYRRTIKFGDFLVTIKIVS